MSLKNEKSYLFPSYFRIIGWVLFVPTAILFVYKLVSTVDIVPTLMIVLAAIGLLFIAFAVNSQEDEYVESVRCRDLVWAVKVSYLILIISTLLMYGGAFLTFIWINMFSVLILFIIKFHISLCSLSKKTANEK